MKHSVNSLNEQNSTLFEFISGHKKSAVYALSSAENSKLTFSLLGKVKLFYSWFHQQSLNLWEVNILNIKISMKNSLGLILLIFFLSLGFAWRVFDVGCVGFWRNWYNFSSPPFHMETRYNIAKKVGASLTALVLHFRLTIINFAARYDLCTSMISFLI